jgi:hypothetical protein
MPEKVLTDVFDQFKDPYNHIVSNFLKPIHKSDNSVLHTAIFALSNIFANKELATRAILNEFHFSSNGLDYRSDLVELLLNICE